MKKFLNDLLTFALFAAAIICFYFAATVAFSSALFNLLLFFAAIFFIIQGAGLIDKANGFGKYSTEDEPTSTHHEHVPHDDEPEDNEN